MILLDFSNAIIKETLLKTACTSQQELLETSFVDFDGVLYRLSTSRLPSKDMAISLSIFIPCYEQLLGYGVLDLVQREYADFTIAAQPEKGFHLTLHLSCSSEMDRAAYTANINRLALLKRNLLSAPFHRAFELQDKYGAQPGQKGCQKSELMAIKYRQNESVYIQAYEDRVCVIFSTVFDDPTDIVLGKVFVQEFVDARRLPNMQNAPQVLFSKEAPAELASLDLKSPLPDRPDDNYSSGFVTFILFPRHIARGERRESTISLIQTFRDYLHYHIKCSKAYLHSRMRARVSESLKILNRAKPHSVDKRAGSLKSFRRA